MYKKDYIETKAKLDYMYKQITKGAIVRSSVKWHEEGETNSKYFMGLEKQKKNVKNSIVELKSKTGKQITKIDEILNESVGYYMYKELYGSREIDEGSINNYVNNTGITQLNPDDSITCDGLLTINECTDVVKRFKSDRSPGSDGLTPEFYKEFGMMLNTW